MSYKLWVLVICVFLIQNGLAKLDASNIRSGEEYGNQSIEDFDFFDEENDGEDHQVIRKAQNREPPFSGRITNVSLSTDFYVSIVSDNFPLPYPGTEGVEAWLLGGQGDDEGYGVEVVVKALDLDGETEDYLMMRPGGEESASESEVIFTWKLKKARKYRLFHMDQLFVKFVHHEKTANTHQGFQIDAKRIGVAVTTVLPPVTEPPPLVLQPLQEAAIYLQGKTPRQFLNVSEEFRLGLAHITELYCQRNNITLAENLTISDNVNYTRIAGCRIDWPDSDKCVEVKYFAAVYFDNDTSTYELTTAHLDDMWNLYSGRMNLTQKGLSLYPIPNDSTIILVWVSISVGVILCFMVVLYFISRTTLFSEYVSTPMGMRDSINSKKQSNASMFPTPHQSVPPLFDLDNYYGKHEELWRDDDLPPKYSEEKPRDTDSSMKGHQNHGFMANTQFYESDSEDEIDFSLPDTIDQQIRIRSSGDIIHESGESNL